MRINRDFDLLFSCVLCGGNKLFHIYRVWLYQMNISQSIVQCIPWLVSMGVFNIIIIMKIFSHSFHLFSTCIHFSIVQTTLQNSFLFSMSDKMLKLVMFCDGIKYFVLNFFSFILVLLSANKSIKLETKFKRHNRFISHGAAHTLGNYVKHGIFTPCHFFVHGITQCPILLSWVLDSTHDFVLSNCPLRFTLPKCNKFLFWAPVFILDNSFAS
jgi:hypothetical protein